MSSYLSRLQATSRAPFVAETVQKWHADLSAHRTRQTGQMAWAADTVGLVALSSQGRLCQSALFNYADAMHAATTPQAAAPRTNEALSGRATRLMQTAVALAVLVGAALVLAGQLVVSIAWFVVYGAFELLASLCRQIWDGIHQEPPQRPVPHAMRPAMSTEAYASGSASIAGDSHVGPVLPPPQTPISSENEIHGVPLRRAGAPRTDIESLTKNIGRLARKLGTLENKQEFARDSAATWSDKARARNTHLTAELFESWVDAMLAVEVTNLAAKYKDVTRVACGALSEVKRLAARVDASPGKHQALTPPQLAMIRILFHETKRSLAAAKSDLEAMHVHFDRAQSAMMAFGRFTARDIERLREVPFRMENLMGAGYVVASTQGDIIALRNATNKFFLATASLFNTAIPQAVSKLSKLQANAGHIVRVIRLSQSYEMHRTLFAE